MYGFQHAPFIASRHTCAVLWKPAPGNQLGRYLTSRNLFREDPTKILISLKLTLGECINKEAARKGSLAEVFKMLQRRGQEGVIGLLDMISIKHTDDDNADLPGLHFGSTSICKS